MNKYTVLPWQLYAILGAFFIFGVTYCDSARAQAFAEAEADGAKVTLYREPCKVDAVSNLPYKAVWTEKGKEYQGCWGQADRLVALYFDGDKTVVVIPTGAFKPLVQS